MSWHIVCFAVSCSELQWVAVSCSESQCVFTMCRDISHSYVAYGPFLNDSCRTCKGVMSHVWMSHVSCLNESCPSDRTLLRGWRGAHSRRQTYEWVIFNIWMRHVSHMNESCHTHTNESGDAYKWVMSPAQALCRRATGGARIPRLEVGAGYYPSRPVTWLIHMCDMTHSYVWHDSSICVMWLFHMCDMTHS